MSGCKRGEDGQVSARQGLKKLDFPHPVGVLLFASSAALALVCLSPMTAVQKSRALASLTFFSYSKVDVIFLMEDFSSGDLSSPDVFFSFRKNTKKASQPPPKLESSGQGIGIEGVASFLLPCIVSVTCKPLSPGSST